MDILVLILLLIGVPAAWVFYKKRRRPTSLPVDPMVRLRGPGTYDIAIMGVSRYRSSLEKICGGRSREQGDKQVEAVLVLEDTNPHDNNAVRVDVQGNTVGYLSSDLAREYRQRLKEGGYLRIRGVCDAKITGMLDHGGGDRVRFSVRLDLPPGKRRSSNGARR